MKYLAALLLTAALAAAQTQPGASSLAGGSVTGGSGGGGSTSLHAYSLLANNTNATANGISFATTANFLTFMGTPSSANLLAAMTDNTGTGPLVFGTGPAITSINLAGTTTFSGTAPMTINATATTGGTYNIIESTGGLPWQFTAVLNLNNDVQDVSSSAGSAGMVPVSNGGSNTGFNWNYRPYSLYLEGPIVGGNSSGTVAAAAAFMFSGDAYATEQSANLVGYKKGRMNGAWHTSSNSTTNQIFGIRYYTSFNSTFTNFLPMGITITYTAGTPSPSAFVNGNVYQITTTGTANWTSIGATAGTVGTTFIYNNTAVTGSGAAAADITFTVPPSTGNSGATGSYVALNSGVTGGTDPIYVVGFQFNGDATNSVLMCLVKADFQ